MSTRRRAPKPIAQLSDHVELAAVEIPADARAAMAQAVAEHTEAKNLFEIAKSRILTAEAQWKAVYFEAMCRLGLNPAEWHRSEDGTQFVRNVEKP